LTQKRIGSVPLDAVYTEDVYDIDRQECYRHIALAGSLYEERRSGESYHSCPAIAAHVTAYARLYLARLVSLAGPGHCLYMDTDSLIVDQAGRNALAPLVDDAELGCLKTEGVSPWVEINTPKDYSMEGRIKTKGVSARAEQLAAGVYLQDAWVRLDGMLQRGDVSHYTIRRGLKRLSRQLYSGAVDPVGWVHPWVLAESCLSGAVAPVALPLRLPQLV